MTKLLILPLLFLCYCEAINFKRDNIIEQKQSNAIAEKDSESQNHDSYYYIHYFNKCNMANDSIKYFKKRLSEKENIFLHFRETATWYLETYDSACTDRVFLDTLVLFNKKLPICSLYSEESVYDGFKTFFLDYGTINTIDNKACYVFMAVNDQYSTSRPLIHTALILTDSLGAITDIETVPANEGIVFDDFYIKGDSIFCDLRNGDSVTKFSYEIK